MFADRIVDLIRVPAGQLRANPRNWRTHPADQRAALRGILAEVGYVDALLARRVADGSLELIDGHLRAEITPESEVPVLVVDLNDAEAAKVLATFDPLAAMAETDAQKLDALLSEVSTHDDDVAGLLAELQRKAGSVQEEAYARPIPIRECYQVIVECRDEQRQREVYERMTGDGYVCRLLVV